MKILKSHLEEKLGKKKNVGKLSDQLTMLGLEVDSITKIKTDYCIDIDLTPNRGDCFSALGVAREIAAADQTVLKKEKSLLKFNGNSKTKVQVQAKEACPKYSYLEISNLSLVDSKGKVKELPKQINSRLEASGINLINPIVDILNYVMLDIGQPMHAFDKNKISGDIKVRFAKTNEKINLLDDQKISLSKDCLLITDTNGPIAFAGIMGSKDSSVELDAKAVLLESAFFTPKFIRGKARKFGIQTDASQRFERGVDFNLQLKALEMASELIVKYLGGSCTKTKEIVSNNYLPKQRKINLSINFLNEKLGTQLSTNKVKQVLKYLDIQILSANLDLIKILTPSHRFDLEIQEDLVEEIARLIGYDNLPTKELKSSQQNFSKTDYSKVLELKKFLANNNFQEVINYSFIDDGLQNELELSKGIIKIQNPLTENLNSMRTSLFPGLITNLISNAKRGNDYLKIYEEGKVFYRNKDIQESSYIAGLVFDQEKKSWNHSSSFDFFSLKEIILSLAKFSNVTDISLKKSKSNLLHPQISADIFKANKKIGSFGKVHPLILKKINFKKPFFYFELKTNELFNSKNLNLLEPSKFPSTQRDLAFIVSEKLGYKELFEEISNCAGKDLIDIKLFDLFKGGELQKNKKSLAFRLTWQSSKETLEDSYIDSAVEKIIKSLTNKFGAKLRS
jgi:phenylalanyl-tRNA synthetase beta chain